VLVSALSLTLAATPVTLASPEFNTLNVTAEMAHFCNEHLAQQLTERGIQVATARQISALLGMERQKQLLGCGDDSSGCVTELANALGADGVLLGDLGRLGDRIQVNLRVLRNNGTVVAAWSRTVAKEDQLISALEDAAEELKPKILGAYGRLTVTKRRWPLIPTIAAGALAVASGVTFGLALSNHGRLIDPLASPGSLAAREADALQQSGDALQWTARFTAGGALVALATSLVLWWVSAEEVPVSLGVVASPGAGALLLGGRF
jgi:hypothetical protein